jgi:hypothetical protein
MAKKTPLFLLDVVKSCQYLRALGLPLKVVQSIMQQLARNLKAPQPEGGARKKSFCARMSGMPGPMKDEKGRPTRKAAS